MKTIARLLGLLAAATLALCAGPAPELHWYKGNTHTHTTKSDGDELPARVVRWYHDHEYNFLVLTDHNTLTPVQALDSDGNDDFLLIPGEEVTDSFERRPAHQCALGIRQVVEPQHGKSMVETMQNDTTASLQAGGLVQINHPNWRAWIGADELLQVKGATLLEVWNASRDVNNVAAGGKPSSEEIWDRVLSGGLAMYAVASDDMHNMLGDHTPDRASPARGWVMVRAAALSVKAILAAMAAGDFYASTGVEFADLQVAKGEYLVQIRAAPDTWYTTTFVGKGGKVLATIFGDRAAYKIRGDEGYVRARVHDSNGCLAFCQPIFLN